MKILNGTSLKYIFFSLILLQTSFFAILLLVELWREQLGIKTAKCFGYFKKKQLQGKCLPDDVAVKLLLM